MNLRPGAVVMALRDLDKYGANVRTGDVGVVFCPSEDQPRDEPGQFFGPLVRWLKTPCFNCTKMHVCIEFGALGGVCNVYDGDVQVIEEMN